MNIPLLFRFLHGMTYHWNWEVVFSTLLSKYPKNQAQRWRLLLMSYTPLLSRIRRKGSLDITRKILLSHPSGIIICFHINVDQGNWMYHFLEWSFFCRILKITCYLCLIMHIFTVYMQECFEFLLFILMKHCMTVWVGNIKIILAFS